VAETSVFERCNVPDAKKDSTSSEQQPSSERSSDETTERLEKEANEMADRAQGVEKRYDQDHDIFTK
jgi:hypothetical protein